MEKDLLEQILAWHEDEEYDAIIKAITNIPVSERSYELTGQLGRALNNAERYREALAQLESVAEQGQNDAVWHFRMGYSYCHLALYDKALEAFERADELEPDDEYTLQFLEELRPKAAKMEEMRQRWAADWEAERKSGAKNPSASIGGSEAGVPGDGVKADSGRSGKDDAAAVRQPFAGFDLDSFWEANSEYIIKDILSQPADDEMIASIEQELGYKLPQSYIALMKTQNGGVPVNTSFPTTESTSWAEDHISITSIMGIGRQKTYSLAGDLGSRFMIEEWGYPDLGVVICDCPSAGHDVVMLDYRFCGPEGEPSVVHVDQEGDYEITYLAHSFEAFVRDLVNDEVFDTSEADKEEDLRMVAEAPFSPLLGELVDKASSEVEGLESKIRHICTEIVQDKGYFALHADERSTLMYDLQFWLYSFSYPGPYRGQYLEVYSRMIAFGGEFSTGGYAPEFITDWLDARIKQGRIVVNDSGVLAMSEAAVKELLAQLDS